jgi:ribosome-associated translation inhibitor RaiA
MRNFSAWPLGELLEVTDAIKHNKERRIQKLSEQPLDVIKTDVLINRNHQK